MHTRSIGKNNFAWQSNLTQFADTNHKSARHAPGAPLPKFENPVKDFVELSTDARELAREAKTPWEEMSNNYQALMDQMEKAKEQGDAMAESAKTRTKCLLIAMRIMSGDDVPAADYRYLAKNDLDLYAKAVSMRMTKENPKKHKRLSEDEKTGGENGAANAGNAAGEPAPTGKIQAEAGADVSGAADSETV